MADLVNAFRKSGEVPDSQAHTFKAVMSLMVRLYRRTPVNEFGPVALKVVRQGMVDLNWKRRNVNNRVHMVRRIFRWGVEMQWVDPTTLLELERRGVTPHTALRAGVIGGAKGTCLRSCQRRASVAPRLRMKERQAEAGYTISQRCRKKIEEAFGWIKIVAGLCRTKLIGQWKINQQVQLAAAAYSLVRMRKLTA